MIPPSWRFYSPEGSLLEGGPWSWVVIDFDRRQCFRVTGPPEALPDEEDAITAVKRYNDQLSPDTYALEISADGKLLSTSPYDDATYEIRYPEYPRPLETGVTAYRSELSEVDRLHVGTDLVEYHDGSKKKELVVFKYTIIHQRVKNIWDELHILKALKGHESFVGFHRVIIDDVSKKVLGFTSNYISGGTLEKYRDQPFYFRWLQQLTSAIDDLNLRFGIMHQDVAPRNVLVDPKSQTLKIFDFDRSAMIGSKKQEKGRNDVDAVIFTVYEALSKDEHYRQIPFPQQDVRKVEALKEWPLVVPLEAGKGGITEVRRFLSKWATSRRTTRLIQHYSEASAPISWPAYPEPEIFTSYMEDGLAMKTTLQLRKDALRVGSYVTRWERPPQVKQ